MAKFSDRFLSNLKPKDAPFLVRDAKGFAIRVFPSGVKTFLFIYERDGKRKQLNLGTYPHTTLAEAREAYAYTLNSLVRGEPLTPPLPEPPPSVTTVKDLQEQYVTHVEADNQAKAWAYSQKMTLAKHLKPWYDRDIKSITKTDAIDLLKGIQTTGQAGRNAKKVFNALFEYAVNMEMIAISPFFRITKVVPNMGGIFKTRVLNEADLHHVWHAIDKGTGSAKAKRILKLILVTGQRPGEVLGIHRRELEGDWWIIPPDRAMKGGRHHRVYLTGTAKKLIGDASGYIFPTRETVTSKENVAMNKVTVSRIVRDEKYYGLQPWTPHDLRRTARTHMARIGVPEEHAEAVLNHAKQGMVQVYNQYAYDKEKQEALLRWEAELLRIVNTQGNM